MKQKMNKLTKLNALICMLVMFAIMPTYSQANASTNIQQQRTEQRKNFKPNQFVKDLEAFITQQAGLTAEEAQQFFPKYHELKKTQRQAMKQINRACKRIEHEKLSEQECKKILQDIEQQQNNYITAQTKAYKEWQKILSAEKIIKVIHADYKFGKRFFKNKSVRTQKK